MKKILGAMLLMLMMIVPAVAATSVASLNGTYNFQLLQYSPNSSQTCESVQGGSGGSVCFDLSSIQITTGTISFNGKGSATFLSCSSCNGKGGPVIGHAYAYTVSGFVANVDGVPNGKGANAAIALSLGSFNSSGVATTALILITNTGGSSSAMTGSANLQ
jgi:hypothetical protein